MIKAHSLLYAVYVCLIVSIICGALLYYSNLYTMLNEFYNQREDLYLQNQSALNYMLSNGDVENDLVDEQTGITTHYELKSHGLLNLVIVKSCLKNDTISSAHFIGHYATRQPAFFLSNFSNPLSYSGSVKLIGEKKLPSTFVEERHIGNALNNFLSIGTIGLSEDFLPKINPNFERVFSTTGSSRIQLKDLEKSNDSIYFNSFLNETIEVQLTSSYLQNTTIKGNFVLYSKDSVVIDKSSQLQDVVIKAPVIRINKGFKGNIQALANEKIVLESNVTLSYPSVLAIYNNSDSKSKISIDEDSAVYGAVVLFGSSILNIDENEIVFSETSRLIGDVYCTGKLMMRGSIYGSVFTNRVFTRTATSNYENCIMDAEIDITKRPDYFVSIPLFTSSKEPYGAFKKVL